MIEGILIGLKTALSFQNLLMVMIGCFAGTIIGMLPGLGPMTAIALMIPITYGFEPSTGLILIFSFPFVAIFMYLLHGLLAVYLRDPLLKYIGIMG